MKKKKVLIILVTSLVIMIATVIVSYLIDSRSQKLPAVVISDKVVLSASVDGTLKGFFVKSMQRVDKQTLIAEIENNKLSLILDNLKNEKRKYDELIASAKSGAYLKSELYQLDGDIEDNTIKLEEARLEISKAREELRILEDRYASSKSKYDANKRLFDKGILSNADFEKASGDFWEVHQAYQGMKVDSLTAYESIRARQSIISLLKARKDILSSGSGVLGSGLLIDVNKVEADINDMQEQVDHLKIYSPIAGFVTDINYRPGEKISKGDVIAEVSDPANMWLIAYGNSFSSHQLIPGQKVRIMCYKSKKVWGTITAVSPVLEKVKSLSSSYETANTYAKIEIKFNDITEALKYVTPGERLFVRIYY
jgi:multidrug resistance efflux pump